MRKGGVVVRDVVGGAIVGAFVVVAIAAEGAVGAVVRGTAGGCTPPTPPPCALGGCAEFRFACWAALRSICAHDPGGDCACDSAATTASMSLIM